MSKIKEIQIGDEIYQIRDAEAAHTLSDVAQAGKGIAFTSSSEQAFIVEGNRVTINDKIATGFNYDSYIIATASDAIIQDENFEIGIKVKCNDFSYGDLLGSNDVDEQMKIPYIKIEYDGEVTGLFSNSGDYYQSYSTQMTTTGADITEGSWVWIKVTGTYIGPSEYKYGIYVSTTGEFDSSSPHVEAMDTGVVLQLSKLCLGAAANWSEMYNFDGSIDLNETYVKINNEIVWTPYSVGSKMIINANSDLRSLTPEQESILRNTGTYDGEVIDNETVFISDSGNFTLYTFYPSSYDGELVSCDFTPESSNPQQEVVWGKLGNTVYYIDASNDPTGAASYEIQGTNSQGLYYSHLGGFFLGDEKTELGYMWYDDNDWWQIDQMDGDFGYINGSSIQYVGVVGKTCGKYFIGEKYSDSIDSYYIAYHYIDEIPINNDSTELHSVTSFPSGVTKPTFFILPDKVIMIDIATGSVYHLTTLGGSWTYDGTSNILNSYSSNCYDSPQVVNDILLVRWQGTWYRSNDYGLTFTQFNSGIDNERANIMYDSDTMTYVAVIDQKPDYYWTSFDCDNWTKQTNMNSCQVGYNSTPNGLLIAESKLYSFYNDAASYVDIKTSGKQISLTNLSYTKTEVDIALAGKQDTLPSQTGHTGEFLKAGSDGLEWDSVDALPSQTSQSGKFLTTDGTTASWAEITTSESVEDLTDVDLTSVSNGQVLIYDSSDSKWKNGTLTGVSFTKITETLYSESWSNKSYSLTVPGVTNNSMIWVQPSYSASGNNELEYAVSNIRGVSQNTDTIVFACVETPTRDVNIDIIIS